VTYFWPSQGQGYLLTTLAAVFIGGTSVFGGMGTIFGTFVGAIIIGSLEAGIIAIGLTGFWIQLIYGLIIMVSVSIYAILLKKKS
jgi:simple sugar transport system permease protein